MGVSFLESMSGMLRTEGGAEKKAEFRVRADATDAARFLRDGHADLSGVVHAPPWAVEAVAEGSLDMRPFDRREMVYRLRFRADDGRELLLTGKKTMRWWAPVRSLTRMPVALLELDGERPGGTVAFGELRFLLRGLLPFLATWSPTSRLARWSAPGSAARPRDAGAADWPEADRLLWRALAEAVIAPGPGVIPADEATLDGVARLLRSGPRALDGAFRRAAHLLDVRARARHGRTFLELTRTERAALVESLAVPTERSGAALAASRAMQVLLVPLKTIHFSRRDSLDALGHPAPTPAREEPAPRWTRNIVPAGASDPETVVEADVAVVGTGAGGGPLAAALARAGLAVAIIEEGAFRRRHEFSGSHLDRIDLLWRNRGITPVVGSAVLIPTGRVVGGTTTINSGTCFSVTDDVLASWREELAFPVDFAPDAFRRWTEPATQALGVALAERAVLGGVAPIIARGAEAMGIDHGPLPRNAPGCSGAGVCIFGCPDGAKRSSDIAWIPPALQAGASLFTGFAVTHVLMRGDRAIAVEARGRGDDGTPRRLIVRAPRIAVCCGTLHSPLLLADSGVRLPRLGRNLSVHPALGLAARVPENIEPWSAIPQGYGIEGHGVEGARYEGLWLPPPIFAGGLPWVGPELTRWMGDFRRIAQFGFMVRDENRGSVFRGPDGSPIVRYSLSRRVLARMAEGVALLSELFLRGGATEVYTAVHRHPAVRSIAEARAMRDRRLHPLDVSPLGAHPLGTCAMAESPQRGVVDFDHRVFGTRNLFVVDGSTVPTSLGVNPQITIMAMALRAADRMLSTPA